MAETIDRNECALCGNDRHDRVKCKCPWHMPFDKWPKALLGKLIERIPNGPSD